MAYKERIKLAALLLFYGVLTFATGFMIGPDRTVILNSEGVAVSAFCTEVSINNMTAHPLRLQLEFDPKEWTTVVTVPGNAGLSSPVMFCRQGEGR